MAVHVFLNDDYSDWEIGYLLPELVQVPQGPGAGIKKNTRQVVTFSLTGGAVKSMGSLVVSPQVSLEKVDADRIEALILPGGLFWQKFSSPKLGDIVRNLIGRGTLVAAICGATGYLARLGVLASTNGTWAGRLTTR